MPELTIRNIEQICSDMRRQEITFSHLLDDLTDHVCCDVEHEMSKGFDFEEAYKRVKKKIGSRRFKEIQEETLYLVDTKYRNMKNLMKFSGIAGTVLFGFAALFKIQHWPGAGVMMTLGALILAFAFLPSSLVVMWKESHSGKRLMLFISAFIAGVFFILGTLFKIQHWPAAGILLCMAALSGILFFIPLALADKLREEGIRQKRAVYITGAAGIILYITGLFFKIQHLPAATIFMIAGMILSCGLALPWYTWLTWRGESNIKAPFIFLIVSSLLVVIPGALINLNLQNSYDSGYYSHLEQEQALGNAIAAGNLTLLASYHDSLCFQKMDQLHSRTAGIISLIARTEQDMVTFSEGKTTIPASDQSQVVLPGAQINVRHLSKPFLTEPVTKYLIPSGPFRKEMNTVLSEYSAYISELDNSPESEMYKSLIAPSLVLNEEITEDHAISLMAGLHSLQLLKNSLLLVESHELSDIIHN